ncbi:MAG: phenylalanine--tRNA ligase subunit beta [Candidatus Omnitrophica bacterium]|nr:phenylalanine--tRNA ligase subunit beta [Candidatus Omnitrophota bacterium]
MKVTYNWLKDFVEIKISPKELAEKFTMAGLEVTSLEEKGGDFVFEIEITSNRPDWLSVTGIAREAAAITNSRLKLPAVKKQKKPGAAVVPFIIKVDDRRDCPLYTAKIIRGVKVGPSPDWLRKRLELVGCRSINNIVDITNYILFTYGEPLHAFDLDKLSGNTINVRRAKNGEKITTIDGQEKALSPDILLIADQKRPVAIAGVMGGQDTEVSYATKNILLEAAVFNLIVVRRGRRILGIQSESSYRFERGVNLEAVDSAAWQAVELMQDLAGGDCALAKSAGLNKVKRKSIILSSTAVNKILGLDIALGRIEKILKSLGFNIQAKPKEAFAVKIPSHRPDVTSGIDLVEEIARIYGYENIPQTLPTVRPQVNARDTRDTVSLIKNILVGLGSNEVITYSLTDKDLLKDFGMHEGFEAVEVLNPLSKEQEVLRPSLTPGLATCVAYNLNQRQDYINIFEVAGVFSQLNNLPREELKLGIALCGIKPLLLKQGLIKEPAGLLDLKGMLEVVFTRLGINDYDFKTDGAVYVAAEKIGLMEKLPGSALEKLDIKNRDVFVAALSLDRLLVHINTGRKFSPLPVYPGISRDISLILKEDISIGDVLGMIKGAAGPLLKDAKVTDYYKGKQIPAGFRGLTISCLYRSDERTLTEAEVSPVHSEVCKLLAGNFAAQIR